MKTNLTITLASAVALSAFGYRAFALSHSPEHDCCTIEWKAQWITDRIDQHPDSAVTEPAPYFRKEFNLDKKVETATLRVSGLGFYELEINGTKVGDQVLAPAVTNYDTRTLKNLLYHYDDQSSQRVFYNTFDVSDLLTHGSNAIGAVLGNGWYNQRDRTVEGHMWYDIPKLIAQLDITFTDGTETTVVSDTTWKTSHGPLLHDAIFTGEVYDARLDLGDWTSPGYNDSNWRSVIPARIPAGRLMPQTVPFNHHSADIATEFEVVNDSTSRFTLPETVSGWCELTVAGAPGDTVVLRHISEEGLDYGQTDTYILRGNSTETWHPQFTWHTFRTVEVISKHASINSRSIRVRPIHTDVAKTGRFHSSDTLLNRLADAFDRTMRANFKGIISSDPHRERLCYTGDGQLVSESLLYTCDMRGFMRKFIDDMADAQNHVTGYVPHTAPFGGGGGGPAWGSAYVVVPWLYFNHYGDTSLLREHYNGMKAWCDYLGTRTDQRGLIVREEPGGWCLGEWCTLHNAVEVPGELVNTAYYHRVASLMAQVAAIIGNEADHHRFISLADSIKTSFNQAFYNPATGHYWEGRQGADAFALAFGLVPDSLKSTVLSSMAAHLESLDRHFDTGILGTPITLEILSDNGYSDLALDLLTARGTPGFDYLLDPANSTLWETWNGDGDEGGRGHCHPMFGSVVAWLYSRLGGVRPHASADGTVHFNISPIPARKLKFCEVAYNTGEGEIVSRWEQQPDGSLKLDIDIPAGVSADITVPAWNGAPQRTVKAAAAGHHTFTAG